MSQTTSLQSAMEEFRLSCESTGLDKRTCQWYMDCVRRYETFVEEQGLDWLEVKTVRAFTAELQHRGERYADHPTRPTLQGGLSVHTVLGYYRALRRFFRFLVADELIVANPMTRVQPPRRTKPLPKAIDTSDLRKLMAAAQTPRDKALVIFLADTGCRISEASELHVRDVNIEQRIAKVRGKGKKERVVVFSPETAKVLSAYFAEVHNDPDASAFQGLRGGLTPTGIYELFRRLKRRAGITGKCNPHSLRHGFAKQWLMNGGDLASLADFLGHEDIQTTKMYSGFSTADLRDLHDRVSPLGEVGRKRDTTE